MKKYSRKKITKFFELVVQTKKILKERLLAEEAETERARAIQEAEKKIITEENERVRVVEENEKKRISEESELLYINEKSKNKSDVDGLEKESITSKDEKRAHLILKITISFALAAFVVYTFLKSRSRNSK